MTRAAAFLVLIPLAGSAAGQKPTASEQAAALASVREYARSYTASLPNYTCIQSTRQRMLGPGTRAFGPPGLSLRAAEIEEQISFVNHKEIRTVTKINGNPPSAEGQAQIISQGEFGNLLDTIFEPKSSAEIHWDREAKLDGREVNVFAYRVPQSSGYALMESKGETRVPFEGLVYADRRTGAVVRIEAKCIKIPAKSEYRAITLALDYKPAKIEDQEYLLPYGFTMQFGMNATALFVAAEYKSYRRFSANSRVTFDGDFDNTHGAVAKPASVVAENTAIRKDPPVTENAAIAENKKAASDQPPLAEPLPAPPIVATPAVVAELAAPASPVAMPAPDTVFRASTQLVQVSVIAQDKDGQPVTDLRRDEFQIFDNGAPQEIRLFLPGAPNSTVPAPQTSGTLTNRLASSGSSVLLLDKLFINGVNSEFPANVHARQKALLALKAIPPGDSIAIYALACRFEVVHEFTTDRDSLLEKLNAFRPGAAPCADATIPENPSPTPDAQQAAVAAAMKSHEQENLNSLAFRREHELGAYEFQIMADHLAGIPGRKNLIWVTGEFYLSPPNLKKLVDANVAIYPVDAIGVMALASPSQKKARHDQLLALAAPSGGVVFFDRDDFEVGIGDAVRDGRASYTLGFYPASENTTAPVHQLGVRASRPGVMLRYRTSYELKPQPPASNNPVAEMVEALNRPVDATVIPITANATRNRDHVDLSVAIDVPSLDPELSEGLWKTQAELVMRFVTADGRPAGEATAQTLSFSLKPATYESMQKGGDPYRSHSDLAIPAEAVELKVLVGSLASGKIGTLTIPLSKLAPSPANPK